MTTFTFEDLLGVLQQAGMQETADLFATWRSYVEPRLASMLPKMGARFQQKGLWAAGETFTAEERTALPFLRQLDDALRAGGSEAAMQMWREFMASPPARDALAAVAA